MTRRLPFLPWLALASLLAACGGSPEDGAAASAPPAAATGAASWGRLKVCGTHICSAGGTQVQLKGMSLFWSNTNWGGERFYNATAVQNLVSGWNINVIRVAMGVEGAGGYLESSTSASANLARATTVIDAAISSGIYVLVDWHYSSATVYQSQAQAFFQQLATKYASSPNIIWEPYNEPTSNSWSSLKSYHTAVIGTIRAAGSQNLVVAGTPTWSQDVDVASADPIADSNTAYTLHFYAGTHGQSLRDKANTAMSKGVAVFVTEWGTCDASGNGNFSSSESSNWTSWMDANKISSANWSINDKAETASALATGVSSTGPWTGSALTQSGAWVYAYLTGGGSSGTTYALTVTKSGTGSGTVTSSSGGISCGSTCSASYASGTAVTLTAAAASGSTFAGWSGACSGTGTTCTVTLSAAQSVTATFNTSGGTTYALTVTKSGTGSGTVTSSSGGISCGSTCSASYASGAVVTLTAAAASGSSFAGWGGSCSGTGTTCAVTMSAAKSASATFNSSGSGSTPCSNPITFTGGQTGNFNTTAAVCYRTTATINGWGCSNFTGRTIAVNNVAMACGAMPLPAKWSDGYYYFAISAGSVSYASMYYW